MGRMLHELSTLPSFYTEPVAHPDARGQFHEWFKASEVEAQLGYPFDLQQANLSRSHAGVVRGLHFADVPPGQEKFVTCVAGEIWDVIVDIRRGSPTFGQWEAVTLSADNRRCLFVPNGFAHGFAALTEATVVYLTTAEYTPAAEHGISPELVPWPVDHPLLSKKDTQAPTLADATEILPTLEACEDYRTELKDSWVMANTAAAEDDAEAGAQ